jgi:hypothetical protein
MQRNLLWIGIAFVALVCATSSALAGGGGPVAITGIGGKVEVKPLTPDTEWRPLTRDGRVPYRRLRNGWQCAKPGELVGTFLLRTGPRSWVHLNSTFGCVDSDSLIHIDSGSDFLVTIRRGQISAVDGKRGKRLARGGWLR